ncbi:NYN domain-containing protein [Actinokineospora enzanensis]|uniref:NYN domain-containing protein n=1 Tax=Actinokineospora enzanensis TaxID=155975 RepID=UPI00037B8CB1|nr:NYN domain-containing protein [Actinokineospora enzanensis]
MRATRQDASLGASVGVYVDFENLVCGAGAGRVNPVPYAAITCLCRDYGNAVIRRAYADWANAQFGRYQQDLAMNGVDLIQVVRFGAARKNAADIRMAVDAMETLITHPEVSVFVLVAGDGDYTPLVQRLREFGKHVVGVGTEANASPRLVSVCSEYKYWGTLVAQVDPGGVDLPSGEFDIADAEALLVSAMGQATVAAPTASWVKSKMISLDPAFDERNYGCRGFRDFLGRLDHRVTTAGTSGSDITLTLVEGPIVLPVSPCVGTAPSRPVGPA